MNTVMIIPAVAPPLYPQRHRVCRLHNVSSRPAQSLAQAETTARKNSACPPVLTLLSLSENIGRPASVASEQTSLAMMHQAEAQAQRLAQAYREGRPASMSAMRFSDWPCFMATVRNLQGGQA
ncbi:hypothetical protein BBB56_22920 [Candidatus Pantoea deserta]|uniref:Uncharacterized protein n=1 Tax=Candidatus Pantoea deserta TaxID=1869313 RepID=A0A3N4N6B5_9GAMM|nr:hypothetical protein BBB56_22920 [Pantoea deserta]